ncbi:GNAT family N-acetyltransferase [Fodinibius sp.]|uniref:GNAT family N-acetyltransferase n=1 Tax=Fodinibius sp. TaxID=1872440 RepID=UPI003561F56C
MQFDIIYSDTKNPTVFSRKDIADFLYEHLDEYGDEKRHISSCISYAYGDEAGQDGFIIVAHRDEQIRGAVIINHTNMGGYIPEHILVYIAVHGEARGQGIGKQLMERSIEATEGDIALHVEPDNPAKYLYEKYGFTSKYLEMRLKK